MDHAAAAPLDKDILKHMLPYLTDTFYNPSSTYLAAKEVRKAIDEARARTAKVLGARPGEIVFTAGATEANNLAIHGVMAKHPNGKLLISAIEHPSVLETAKQYNYSFIPVDDTGHIQLNKLEKLLTDDVVLVSIVYANNEIGTVQYFGLINEVLSKARSKRMFNGQLTFPLYLHTDAAQAPNLLTVNASKKSFDLMSLNGGKIYGPKQSGALYVKTGIELSPLIHGGGQEFNLRSGTENVAGIVGFSFALEKASELRNAEEKRMGELWKFFYDQITAKLPKVEVTAAGQGLYSIMHIIVPGTDNERLMMELDEAGIQCAVGSACSASDDEPSHVLKAIGMSDEQAQSSLRFSMGRSTTKADIQKAVDTLAKLV